MPPRIRLRPQNLLPSSTQYICRQCRHASVATATTPAPPIEQTINAAPPIQRYPSTQPPSYKPAEFRKSQLHRQYQSLLRSSQLMIIFQHNNLKATEWTGIRRELAAAMRKVDAELGDGGFVGLESKMTVVQTGIFASALRIVEFWDPVFEESGEIKEAHGLSEEAYQIANRDKKTQTHGLEPLLSGPLAVFTMPTVSPQHLKAALSILSPSPDFPAPKRKASPSYHEPAVQAGLQKLMLLGARIEGKVFDIEGARWVGGIQGGLDGLRAQLVAMLQGAGAGITQTLEAASKSLYLTMESRKTMLEDEAKGEGKSESG